MNIGVSQAQGRVPVAILSIQGNLDASNYQELIAKAKEVYHEGIGHILIDLTGTAFISSSGLVALHSIASLLRREQSPDPEYGWSAIHAVGRGLGPGTQQRLKLLSPQPKVDRTLTIAGLKELFEIHTDLTTAVASF